MAPRIYTLGRRADTVAATRRRILDAALETYRDTGVDATSLTTIAKRADVSRGTILNHFGSADGLLGEALDDLLERLEIPDERILDGVVGSEARIRAFVDAMIAFQERSTSWWTTFQSEMSHPALQAREATYWAAFERLLMSALGPELAADPRAGAVVTALSHPATVGTFTWSFSRSGRSAAEARQFVGDLAVDAIRRIAAEITKGGNG